MKIPRKHKLNETEEIQNQKQIKTEHRIEDDSFMSIAAHGNYCGPGWSAGKKQLSVCGPPGSAIDALDESCRIHDCAYDKKNKYKQNKGYADMKFALENIMRIDNPKAQLFGAIVGAQGIARAIGLYDDSSREVKQKTRKRLKTEPMKKKKSQKIRIYDKLNAQYLSSVKKMPVRYVRRGRRMVRVRKPYKRYKKVAKKVTRVPRKKYARKRKYNKVNVNYSGVNYKFETGGLKTYDNFSAGYIGLGMPMLTFWQNCCRAIIRRIMLKLGYNFVDWDQTLGDVVAGVNRLEYIIDYRLTDPSTGITTSNFMTYNSGSIPASVSTNSFELYATEMQELIWRNLTVTNNHTLMGIRVVLVKEGGDDIVDKCYIDLTNFSFSVKHKCMMKVQNNTLSRGADEDANVSTNIANNPLDGILYKNNGKWRNYLDMNSKDGTAAADVYTTVAEKNNGILNINPESISQNDYRKFPRPAAFGFKKAYKFVIMPGEIKYTSLSFKTRISLNSILKRFRLTTKGAGNANWEAADFGHMFLLGFEKTIHSVGNSPNINISYQLEHSFKIVGKEGKKKACLSRVVIVNPPNAV